MKGMNKQKKNQKKKKGGNPPIQDSPKPNPKKKK
jgi:hypothetical protein